MVLKNLPSPKGINNLSNQDILIGNTVAPIDRLKIVDEDTYEDMVLEWLTAHGTTYKKMARLGGSGDKGIDVIAYLDSGKKTFHYFQCKHYNHQLAPSDIYLELGKLCYYTFTTVIEKPLKYYFVAPQGIGPKLHGLIRDTSQLKKNLLKEWDDKCKTKITSKKSIALDSKLENHINNFDFTILDHIEPIDFIKDFRTTGFYSFRFGGGLQKSRDLITIEKPKADIDDREITYVKKIFEAYSDYLVAPIKTQNDFYLNETLKNHFLRQRTNFYHAESLEQFSRDALPFGNTAFNDLKDEVYEQIVEVCESDKHENGFVRLNETTNMAKTSSYSSSPLTSELKAQDKSGICHHLSNEDRLKWIK